MQRTTLSPGKRTLTDLALPAAHPGVPARGAVSIDAARELTDDEVAADAEDLDRRLATTMDANERRALRKGRQELEWLQYERGTGRPFQAPDERYQRLPATAVEMRQYLEPLVARRGVSVDREHLYNVAFGSDLEPQNRQYDLGLQQLQLIESDMQAFRAELRPEARRAADDILDQSEQEIGAGLSSYGLAVDRKVLSLAAMFQLKDDDYLDTAVEVVMRLSASDSARFPDQAGRLHAASGDRAELATVARAEEPAGERRHATGPARAARRGISAAGGRRRSPRAGRGRSGARAPRGRDRAGAATAPDAVARGGAGPPDPRGVSQPGPRYARSG